MSPLSTEVGELNLAWTETPPWCSDLWSDGLDGFCVVGSQMPSVRERWYKAQFFQPAVVEEPVCSERGRERTICGYWTAEAYCKLPSDQKVANLFHLQCPQDVLPVCASSQVLFGHWKLRLQHKIFAGIEALASNTCQLELRQAMTTVKGLGKQSKENLKVEK